MLIEIIKGLMEIGLQFLFMGKRLPCFVVQFRECTFEIVLQGKSIQIQLICGWRTLGLSVSSTGNYFKHFSNNSHLFHLTIVMNMKEV